MQVKKIVDFVKKVINYSIKRKYLVVLIVFAIWLIIFDKNSLINQLKNKAKLNKLETEENYYLEKITVDSTKLHELITDDENLEKYAREEYLMHKENEDVFIVIEDE